MSGLSSRVMNMKFMKSADDNNNIVSHQKNHPQQQEVNQKKVKDLSEWAVKDSKQILAKNKTNNVQSVGYGSIHMFDDDDDSSDNDNVTNNDNDSTTHEVIPKTIKRSWGNEIPQYTVDDDTPAFDLDSIKGSSSNENVCIYDSIYNLCLTYLY